MERSTFRFIILGILLCIASMLQFLGVSILGVMPNFVLVVIIIAALFLADIWHELFLISLASFLLKFSPTVEREILAFFAVSLLIVIFERRLPWHTFINGIFLTVCSTVLLYALIDARSIGSLIFVQELVYTVISVSVLYYGLTSLRLFRNIR